MARIDYFFTLMSPYAYLAGDRMEQVARKRGAEVVYRPVDGGKVLAATGGKPLAERHPSRLDYRAQDLTRLAEIAEAPFNLKPKHWPADATLAHCAIIAAQANGEDAGRITRNLLRACWGEEKDVADASVISAALAEAGATHASPMAIEGARAQHDANTTDAIASGVFGFPFYAVDGDLFWGQDRIAQLDWRLGKSA